MRTEIERELRNTWLLLEFEEFYEEDYQMRMLQANTIPGILSVRGQGVDAKSRYRYDVSGKSCMKIFGEQEGWGYVQIEQFMRQFVSVLSEVSNYLLDVNCISLNPEHIFYIEEKFYFCYCPALKQNLWEEFHGLTEYFVKETNYDDKEAVYFAYELHKVSMEDNYNIEEILENILERKELEMNRIKGSVEEMSYELEDDKILGDWAEQKRYQDKVVRETHGVWGFVSRKLQKKQ